MQLVETITAKVDAAARIPTDRRQSVVAAPKSVKIELTSRCNLACSYCAQPGRDGNGADMDQGLFERIAFDAIKAGVEEFGLFYLGEPFMSPERLVSAIRFLKSGGAKYVFLTSNATIATPLLVKRCMRAGLDSLKWSVNSAGPEEFEKMMGRPARLWNIAMNNIAKAYHLRAKLGALTRLYASSIRYTNQSKERQAAMEDMVAKVVAPYVDEHYWLPLYSMGSAGDKSVGETKYSPTAGNQGRADNPVPPIPCWSLFTVAHVMVDGRMTACCFDSDGKWVVGDLKQSSFMECWNSDEFQKLRKAHLAGSVAGTACEECCLSR